MMKWWCAIVCLGLVDVAQLANGVAEDAMMNQCNELKAQEHLDLNEVMGKWYVVEVIEHKSDIRQGNIEGGGITSTSRVLIDVCPIVKLRSIETSLVQEGIPRISLLWEEDAGTLEYTFWVSKNRGPSVWESDIIQNGTLANNPFYKQFVGTVHLMKAVASHMVVTFCTRNIDGQKFSILLGREYKLPKTDLRGVHKLLERRNLQLLNIRESCAYGSASLSHGRENLIWLNFLVISFWTMLRLLND